MVLERPSHGLLKQEGKRPNVYWMGNAVRTPFFPRYLPHKMGDGLGASSLNVRGAHNAAAAAGVVDDDGGLPIRFRASANGVGHVVRRSGLQACNNIIGLGK